MERFVEWAEGGPGLPRGRGCCGWCRILSAAVAADPHSDVLRRRVRRTGRRGLLRGAVPEYLFDRRCLAERSTTSSRRWVCGAAKQRGICACLS